MFDNKSKSQANDRKPRKPRNGAPPAQRSLTAEKLHEIVGGASAVDYGGPRRLS